MAPLHPPCRDLLGDGALGLRMDPALEPALERWAWPLSDLLVPDTPPRARIDVRTEEADPSPLPPGEPTVHARHLGAWVHPAGGVTLASADAPVRGWIDLDRHRAGIAAGPAAAESEPGRLALYGAAWIASALLLGRQARVMVHAAAVVDPRGGAWLLAADTHSGKTSTCVNLIRSGCGYLSDDHVVVAAAADGLRARGWPRRFHLDEGFHAGRAGGHRAPVDPARFGPGRRVSEAPLAGLLFPRVRADEPTRAERMPPAAALGRLIRHAPWLLADPAAAPPLLQTMTRMSALPAYELSLGMDCYTDPALLRDRLPWN